MFKRMLTRRAAAMAALGLALAGTSFGGEGPAQRPMQLADLFQFHRVTDPQISPDGQWIAYVITDVVMAENRTNSDIWVVPAAGGPPRQLTTSPRHDRHPRWSPDGRWIAFESTRDGEAQVYLLPVAGGEPRQLTRLAGGASSPVWSPTGRHLAFTSSVYPEFSPLPFAEAERRNRDRLAAQDASRVKARLYEELFFRHWDKWSDGRRTHLFVLELDGAGATVADPRNITPGPNDGVPNSDTFAAGEDFAFSPDGREVLTTLPPLPTREQSWSTNYDVWAINLTSGERRNLTGDNPAADGYPRFSPDGRSVAYRAQRRPGAEADKWDVVVLDRTTGQRRVVTAQWDRSVDRFSWSADGRSLVAEAHEGGSQPLFAVPLDPGPVRPLAIAGVNGSVSVARDGRWIAFLHHRSTLPPEIARLDLGQSTPGLVTQTNAGLLAPIAFHEPESVTVPGAGGAPVQMWIIRPPNFDPARKYPLVFWVHGGPQGAWMDAWSTRWNPQIWAAQGYVLALPNPRGSTGFGQRFTDEISRDWGGKVYEDLMACLAYMKRQTYIDPDRMASAGASYGGYMMNWFQGHTREFKCLINHDGVYNFNTMYTTTDELWFDEHEHGIPWQDADFDKFSPHRFAANWSTPMLVIHNDLDFRCPVSEGLAAFTTLQRKGIRSKLLMFPDEGHWVLKPQNSERWHQEVFKWLGEYLKE